MNKFNLYVWVGLELNISLLGSLLYMLQTGELIIDGSDGAQNAHLMRILMIIACVSFPIQLISMMIMSYKPRVAIGVALISSLALMPITIVFLCGMIFSAIRWRFHQLESVDPTIKVDFDTNLVFNNRHNTLRAIIVGVLGAVFVVLSQSLGMFLIVLAILLFILGKRIHGTPYVATKGSYFYIRPSLFSLYYRIPLKDVTYLRNEKNTVLLQAQAGQGSQNMIPLSISLSHLSEEDKNKLGEILEKVAH
ncbi:hypothetical protein AB6H11_14240 [Providencia vermicola]|uniref:hypothetical protein n=1 Tax=Providencia vermicola TaxID=333965 RepID=UPI0034DD9720